MTSAQNAAARSRAVTSGNPAPGTGTGSVRAGDAAPRRDAKRADSRDASPSREPATPAPARPAKPGKSKKITPEQALANTRVLLQAKQLNAHQPPPYPTSEPGHRVHDGYQSHDAAVAANDRHLGEVNSTAIHGHIAAQVRSEQGKRDKR